MALDLKAIEGAFKKIEKRDKEAVVDLATYSDIPRVPTRSPALNKILGGVDVQGIPEARIIEIGGENSHGKSLLGYMIAGSFQDAGEYACILDHEHAFSHEFSEKQGLCTSPDCFKLLRPKTITEGFEMIELLITSGVKLCIIDSVAMALTQAEIDADYEQALMAVKARAIGRGIAKLTPLLDETGATLIIINQYRASMAQYGEEVVTTGGKMIPYASSIRLKVQRMGYIKQGETPIGFKMKVTTIKNKTHVPFQKCELNFMYETGLDTFTDVIELFIDRDVIFKGGGGNYTFEDLEGEPVKIRGMLNLIDYFKENEELFNKYKARVGLVKESEEE